MLTEPKRMKMKRGTFKVARVGPRGCEVTGLVDSSGLFGIHRSAGWTVTHIPSGRAIGKFDTQAKCRAWITALLGMPDVDWTQTDVAHYDNNKELSARLRAMLQAIKVGGTVT